jgi:heme/copper-type cytochrome/quinol oxidase subunit 2
MSVLADAAPNGAGLAIIAIILLAFVALVVGVVAFVVVMIVRARRRTPETMSSSWTPPAGPPS